MSTLNLNFKKVLALSLFLALAPYLVNAQVEWLDPSFNPVNDLSIPIWRKGRVGIGIDNPSRPLHLRGSNTVLQIDRDTKDPGFGVTRWSPGFGEVWKSFFFYTEGNGPNDGRFIIADWGQNVRGPSTPRFVIDNVGNIGVGTVNPDAKLHVVTTSNNNRDNTALFRAPNIGPNSSHIHWGPQGDWYIRSANVKGRVILQDVGGYVGVGTATPNRTLHLVGGTETSIITRIESQNVNGSTIDFKDPNTTGDWLARIGGKGDGLTFIAGGVERMNINPNGFVGIGTSTPGSRLDVNGTTTTRALSVTEQLGVGTSEPDGAIHILSQSSPQAGLPTQKNGLLLGTTGTSGYKWIQSYGGVLSLNPQGNRVGIGTTNPTATLTVNGKVLAEEMEIIVDVPSSDFVFEDDYKLRSLEELEDFVTRYKHLPEIPSAKEFKENGYKIGEMDDLLLRKVEELTLYLIAIKKENDLLKSKMNELIKRK